jgi:VirE N-terminal domain/Primase C terminal 2 (PriCT-2)
MADMKKTFSFYAGGIKSTIPTATIDLFEVNKILKSVKYQNQIEAIRQTSNKKQQSKLKSQLDYVTFSGVFSRRKADCLESYSFLICLDFDNISNIDGLAKEVYQNPFVALGFISPSGNGLKIVIEVDTFSHEIAWQQLFEYFKQKYNIEADKGKDVSRSCFISYDVNSYFNPNSAIFQIQELGKELDAKKLTIEAPLKPLSLPILETNKPIAAKANQAPLKPIKIALNEADFARASLVVERIKKAKVSITDDYSDWINIGFALAIFGEPGRTLYHDVSNLYPKYDMKETDKKFDDFLAKNNFNSPAFFFKKAKEFGIPILREISSNSEDNICQNEAISENNFVRYDLQNFKITVKSAKGYATISEGFLFYIKFETIDEHNNYTWVLEILKPDAEPFYIELSNESFFDIRELERVFGTKRLSLNVKSDQLQKIKAFLYNSTQISDAYKIIRLGFQYEHDTELYFFSNCAITKTGEILYPDNLGMLKFKDYYYSLPQINKYQNSPFNYIDNDVMYNRWYSLFSLSQREEVTFLAASFFLFSLFRDVGIKVNSFSPMLFISGIAGTSKSTVFIHLNYLFGANGKEMGINLKGRNSEAGFNAKAEQRSNGFLFADEYVPNHPLTPVLQGFYDNKGYSKMNMNSKSHLDTIDLVPKCTIGIASNFLPSLPDDEPFFSRLVLLINNNRERTDLQKKAFRDLQVLQENGITNVLREIWMHRDLVKKEFKEAYQTLKNALEIHFKPYNIGNPRYIYNIAQILTVPYILSIHGKIIMCEATSPIDILAEFIKRSEKSILDSDNTVKDKTPLKEFFEFMQELNDRGLLSEGVHYKFDGAEIIINLDRLYKKFEFEFKKMNRFEIQAPSIQTIQDEILTFVGLDSNNQNVKDQFFRKIRFKNEIERIPSNSPMLVMKVFWQ